MVLFSVVALGMAGMTATCSGMSGLQMGGEIIGSGADKVGVVELIGPITETTKTIREIRKFSNAPELQAIILRVDSPGGAVAPSQEVFHAMRAASKIKPVVVSMGSVAASGGFWIAMAGDYIFASAGSITGSIGVISQSPDLRRVAEFLGFDMRTYKSGKHKDMGNPFREMTEADEAVFMDLIKDVYDQFVQIIVERRGLDRAAVEKFADGRVFTGRAAHGYGVVDELGGLYDAAHKGILMARTREAKKLGQPEDSIRKDTDLSLVYPEKPRPSVLELLTESAGHRFVDGMAKSLERRSSRAQIELR